ncbi:hypothetical protein [Arthrobacter sp. AL12]|uniref:hypothetical protein n=1 Tax=Arthrobacter sp. AL12 TaxID=3042241 RepID=UPI00249AAF9D|nr:hypothetical protein [Arthrobacter sp. AL12]MDI3213944.1 hypothetical protein [Arthrobacter sp. AL12]
MVTEPNDSRPTTESSRDATEPRSGRPTNAELEVRGAAWARLVLRDVISGNRRHFREMLAKSKEGITS